MMCREYRGELMEVARGGACDASTRDHVERCAECARFLEEQRILSAALSQLAEAELPAAGEFAGPVMAEFDLQKTARSQAWRWTVAAALAAALCLALVRIGTPKAAPPVLEQPFVAIPYTVPLAPEERATVARMEIPVSALLAAGYHVQPADPTAVVEADVLVGQDGRVRAVRPISFTLSN
jgi:hypothetical protein